MQYPEQQRDGKGLGRWGLVGHGQGFGFYFNSNGKYRRVLRMGAACSEVHFYRSLWSHLRKLTLVGSE